MRWLPLLLLLTACGQADREDRQLAERTCGSCHAFPEPELLPQQAWTDHVLPEMGKLMGLSFINGVPVKDLYSPASITPEEYQRILAYFREHSPEALPPPDRAPVTDITPLFSVQDPLGPSVPPATTWVGMDTLNQQLLSAALTDSSFYRYSLPHQRWARSPLGKVIVDLTPAGNSGLLTHIGLMHPNDGRSGALYKYTALPSGKIEISGLIADSLSRPVGTTRTDLDRDGREDYLVSGYGHGSGGIYWIRNTGPGWEKRTLLSRPGCLRTVVRDANGDGRPDIYALFAQADEALVLLLQQPDGTFTPQTELRFPPVQGSSYFDLVDLNGDGREDLLYTCGDNADLTSTVRKPYHGIYGYLQTESRKWEQAFFYPMHGAFKAAAHDFDGDGDRDIAAISYFPDTETRPQESFLYLEQTTPMKFKGYTIRESRMGNWLTMDTGDADGDGDTDIIIGSLIPPGKQGFTAGKGPACLFLENRSPRSTVHSRR